MIPSKLSSVVRERVNNYLMQRLDNPAFHSRLHVNEEDILPDAVDSEHCEWTLLYADKSRVLLFLAGIHRVVTASSSQGRLP